MCETAQRNSSQTVPWPGRLTGSINVTRWDERTGERIRKKERAEGFDRLSRPRRHKTAEGRTCGQTRPPEKGQEGGGTRVPLRVQRLQRALAADGRAEQHRHEIEHIVVTNATTSEAHARSHQSDVPEPGRRRRR